MQTNLSPRQMMVTRKVCWSHTHHMLKKGARIIQTSSVNQVLGPTSRNLISFRLRWLFLSLLTRTWLSVSLTIWRQFVFLLHNGSNNSFFDRFRGCFPFREPRFALTSNEAVKLHFQMLAPLSVRSLHCLEWLGITIVEIFRQLLHGVGALAKLGWSDHCLLLEVAVAVKDLVHFVLDFGL